MSRMLRLVCCEVCGQDVGFVPVGEPAVCPDCREPEEAS